MSGSMDMAAVSTRIIRRLEALPKCNAESLRSLRREFSPEIASAGPGEVIDLAVALLPDAMVVKALSWALRALAVRDPDAVRPFLKRNGARLAPLVVREVRNNLETGRKTGRRTGGP